jgi:hypothetical protein
MTDRTRAELAVAILAALLASACSSTAHGRGASAAVPAVTATCQQVSAVLGESSSAKEAVSVASNKLDSICPGAAS